MAERKVQIRVSVDDADAVKRLDALAAKLDKISKGTFTIKLGLDDGGTTAKLDKIAERLDRIGHETFTPKIDGSGIARLSLELDKVNAQLDAIGHKRVTADVRVRTGRVGALAGAGGSLIKDAEKAAAGGGGSGGGALGGGLLSGLAGANNQYMGALIAALVAEATMIAPAIIPFGLGGLIGGGAAGGAFMIGSTAHQKLLQLTQQLAGAKGPQKQALQQQIAGIQQRNAPELQTFGAFTQLGHSALSVFNEALTSKGQGFSGGPGGHPGTSFLQGLDAMLKGMVPFLKAMGPLMGQLFRASLPSMEAFMKIMLQFAKAVMPAVLQVLKALQPQLPIIVRGFLYLSNGIAGFIKNLGPGIKDGAIIFKTSMMVVGATLRLIGSVATGFDILIVKTIEGIKTAGPVAVRGFEQMFHMIASLFDTWRHNWAAIWDLVYSGTIGTVIRIDRAVIEWFDKIPSQVQAALRGLGLMLERIGKLALEMLLSGLRSAAGPVLNFVQSVGHNIMHIFDVAIGRHSPSKAFFAAGVDIMRGLNNGIRSHYPVIQGRMAHLGGSVTSWITAAIRGAGAPMSWLPALERLVSLESGGNPRAVNPMAIAGGQHATGLWQMLPSTFAAYGGRGSLFNPITEGIAALRYISSRYGSPFNIPGLSGGGYRGYRHGGIITEPIMGMGLRSGTTYGFGEGGIHERVTPIGGGGAGGGGVSIVIQGAIDTDATARQVIKVLKRYQTRNGGIALNLA